MPPTTPPAILPLRCLLEALLPEVHPASSDPVGFATAVMYRTVVDVPSVVVRVETVVTSGEQCMAVVEVGIE